MDVFTAVAEPTRRSIVELLAKKGELSASEIQKKFHVSPPAISQHLRVLRDAQVVDVEKRGQQRIYTMNPDALLLLAEWAMLMHQRFDKLEAVLQKEKQKTLKSKKK